MKNKGKRKFGRIVSMLLAFVLIFECVDIPVYAAMETLQVGEGENVTDNTQEISDNSSEYQGTSLSDYLFGNEEREISEESDVKAETEDKQAQDASLDVVKEEDQEDDTNSPDDVEVKTEDAWGIYGIEVEDNSATVAYSAAEDATIIVCVYTEDDKKMLQSQGVEITKKEHYAQFDFLEDLPKYFKLKAYIVDSASRQLYGQPYESWTYTQKTQEFLETTIDDYDQDKVLNLDNDRETNFLVFSDESIHLDDAMETNHLDSVDEQNGVYIFTEIDDTLKGASEGNIISYYHTESNDMDIISIGDIEIDNSARTAVVTRDHRSLDEVIPYIQVEVGNGIKQNDEIDVEIAQNQEIQSENTVTIMEDRREIEETLCTIPLTGKDSLVDGQVVVKLSLTIYKIENQKEVDCILELSGTIKLEAGIGLIITIPIFDGEVPIGYGFNVFFSEKIVVKGELEASVSYTLKCIAGVTCNNYNDEKEYKSTKICIVDGSLDINAGAHLKIGFEMALGVSFITEKLANISMKVEFSRQYNANMTLLSTSNLSHHLCKRCIDGNVTDSVVITPVFQAFYNIFKDEYEIDSSRWVYPFKGPIFPINIVDKSFFYYSLDNKEYGKDQTCPHYGYVTKVIVKDENGKPIKGAEVSCTDECVFRQIKSEYGKDEDEWVRCPKVPNGFVRDTDYTWPTTDDKGQILNIFYPIPGEHRFNASAKGYKSGSNCVMVKKDRATNIVQITLKKETSGGGGSGGEGGSGFGGEGGSGSGGEGGSGSGSGAGGSSSETETKPQIIESGSYNNLSWTYDSTNTMRVWGEDSVAPDGIASLAGVLSVVPWNLVTSERIVESDEPFKVIISVRNIKASKITSSVVEELVFKGSTFSDEVTSIEGMFSGCYALGSVDMGDLNFENITNIDQLFRGCSYLKKADFSNVQLTNVESTAAMFGECQNLIDVDFSDAELANVTNAAGMFAGCGFESVDLSEIGMDTHNCKNMGGMFSGCEKLKQINVNSIDVSSATDLRGFFKHCESLETIDLSNWKTPRVQDITGMFANCSNLKSVNVSTWDTKSVISMRSIFWGCKNLQAIDLSNWKTPRVQDISWMFGNCSNLKSVNVSTWDTKSVISMNGIFEGCKSLETIDLSNWKTLRVHEAYDMFKDCSALQKVDMRLFFNYGRDGFERMFDGADNIEQIIISKYLTIREPAVADKYVVVECDYNPYEDDYHSEDYETENDSDDYDSDEIASDHYNRESVSKTTTEEMLGAEESCSIQYDEDENVWNAYLTDLTPNETYMMYVAEDEKEKNTLSGNQLLYVNCITANEEGGYVKSLSLRKNYDEPYIYVVGKETNDLSKGSLFVSDIPYTGEYQYVMPMVILGNQYLTEGIDYELVGDIGAMEIGSYSIEINGIGAYHGTLSQNYRIRCWHKYDTNWTVDVPATEDSVGQTSRHCTICGHKGYVKEIPILSDHEDPEEGEDDGSATPTPGANSTPSPTPGVNKTPSPAPVTQNPTGANAATPVPSTVPESALAVGKTMTLSNMTYKVIKSSKDGLEVKFTGIKNKNVKNIVIPSQVTYLGYSYQVTGIDKNAFKKCKKLKKVIIKTAKLNAKNIDKGTFKPIQKKVTMSVPKAKKKAYQKMFKTKGLNKAIKLKA